MTVRTIGISVVAGVASAACLTPMVWGGLPGLWLTAWSDPPNLLQGLLALLAAVPLAIAGRGSDGAWRSGMIAGSVLYVLIGAAAAGVVAMGPFLTEVPFGEADVEPMRLALAQAVLAAPVAQGVGWLACVVSSVALATVGQRRGPHPDPPAFGSMELWMSVLLIHAFVATVAVRAMLEVETNVAAVFELPELRWQTVVLVLPGASACGWMVGALWVIAQRVHGGWNHGDPVFRPRVRMTTVISAGAPILTWALMALTLPDHGFRPALLTLFLAPVLMGAWVVRQALLSNVLAQPDDADTASVVVEAALAAVLWTSSVGMTAMSMGLVLATATIPYVELGGTPPSAPDALSTLFLRLSGYGGLAMLGLFLTNTLQFGVLAWIQHQARARAERDAIPAD